MGAFVKNFTEIGLADVGEVGIKNALLGELYNHMTSTDTNATQGFAITVSAYNDFITANAIDIPLNNLMAGLDIQTLSNLEITGAKSRKLIMGAKIPARLELAITDAYSTCFSISDQEVAVRCSLDKDYTECGNSIYETHLNIKGRFALIYAIKCCYAAVYSNKAIKFRVDNDLSLNAIPISIGIQKMVRADLACSGTGKILTGTGYLKKIKISGEWGLGADTAQASVPDDYTISLSSDGKSNIFKKIGDKSGMLVYNEPAAGLNTTNWRITPPELREKFTLIEPEAINLAKLILKAQEYFKEPMLFKWAKDGLDNSLHLIGLKAALSPADKIL